MGVCTMALILISKNDILGDVLSYSRKPRLQFGGRSCLEPAHTNESFSNVFMFLKSDDQYSMSICLVN